LWATANTGQGAAFSFTLPDEAAEGEGGLQVAEVWRTRKPAK
jgi:hypothetical protein